jgi:hypothetical protein
MTPPEGEDWMQARPPVSPPAVWPEDFDNLDEKAGLEAAIAEQQSFIDAMEAHLRTVVDPAVRTKIENRIAEHRSTLWYLQRQLHNFP